ncbi:hypothetical protein NDU88_003811, partial [Pleurodeles waltl]
EVSGLGVIFFSPCTIWQDGVSPPLVCPHSPHPFVTRGLKRSPWGPAARSAPGVPVPCAYPFIVSWACGEWMCFFYIFWLGALVCSPVSSAQLHRRRQSRAWARGLSFASSPRRTEDFSPGEHFEEHSKERHHRQAPTWG